MTKKQSIATCALINVLFIIAQIYKHTQFVQYTYNKQKQEVLLNEYEQTAATLTQQLYACKDRTSIKKFAQDKLGMKPITLAQIKRLSP
jgi:hypothetical protein